MRRSPSSLPHARARSRLCSEACLALRGPSWPQAAALAPAARRLDAKGRSPLEALGCGWARRLRSRPSPSLRLRLSRSARESACLCGVRWGHRHVDSFTALLSRRPRSGRGEGGVLAACQRPGRVTAGQHRLRSDAAGLSACGTHRQTAGARKRGRQDGLHRAPRCSLHQPGFGTAWTGSDAVARRIGRTATGRSGQGPCSWRPRAVGNPAELRCTSRETETAHKGWPAAEREP